MSVEIVSGYQPWLAGRLLGDGPLQMGSMSEIGHDPTILQRHNLWQDLSVIIQHAAHPWLWVEWMHENIAGLEEIE